MMWDKLEYPPQPFGQCSVCSRHECGDVIEDGVKKQRWLHLPIELDKGGRLVIGYQCVRGMSEDLGVAVRVVEREVKVQPSDEQVLRVWSNVVKGFAIGTGTTVEEVVHGPLSNDESEQPKTRQRRTAK